MSTFASLIDDESKQSIKFVLSLVRQFLRFILFFIWIPIACAIFLGLHYQNKEKEKKDLYRASYTFIKSSQISGSSTPSVSIPGLSLGKNSEDKSSDNLLIPILKSDEVTSNALFSPISDDNNKDFLINMIVSEYYPNDFTNHYFQHGTIDSLTLEQNQVYRKVYNLLHNQEYGILKFTSSETNNLTALTTSEDLSLAIVKNIYKSLNEFYEKNANLSYSKQLNRLINKRDSSYNLMRYYQGVLLKEQEQGTFIKTPTETKDIIEFKGNLERSTQEYQNFYAQVEQMKFSKNEEKVFRILNFPIQPLSAIKPNIKKQLTTGAAIGFAIGLFFIIFLFILIEIFKLIKSL